MNAAEVTGANSSANLILAALAFFLAGVGAIAWWVAVHPQTVRTFIYGLRDHPLVIRAGQHYRGQIEFLVRRLKPEGAFGLSFTVGLAALAVSVWIFGAVLEDVLGHEEMALIDAPIVSYIAIHRLAWLTTCMERITYLGSAALLTAMVIAGSLCLRLRTGSWRPLLLLASAAVGAMTLDTVLKYSIARPRPATEWMVGSAVGWAFPSGHTTESTGRLRRACVLNRRDSSHLACENPVVGVRPHACLSHRHLAHLPRSPLAHRCDERLGLRCRLAGGRLHIFIDG